MQNQPLEKMLDEIPVYGSHGQIGTVGDVENPEHHDQLIYSLKKTYEQDQSDEKE